MKQNRGPRDAKESNFRTWRGIHRLQVVSPLVEYRGQRMQNKWMCKHNIQCMTASIAYEQRVAKPQNVSSVGVRRQAKKETAVVSYNISAPLTGPDNNHCSPSFCLSSDAWATCNFWLHISSSHTHDCPLVLHSSLCSSPPIFKQERDSSHSSVYT